MLRQRQDSVELLDTQSTNGTFLNDVRVERAVLKDGDVVRFGVLGPKVKICLTAGRDLQAPANPALPAAPQTSADGANNADALAPTPATPAEDHLDEPVNHWRMVRTALMFYAGGSVAAIGVVNTVIDLYQLDVRWFSVFLIFMGGGVVSTAVEAWYRATPGTQKIRLWEVLVHLLLIASCVGISALLWR